MTDTIKSVSIELERPDGSRFKRVLEGTDLRDFSAYFYSLCCESLEEVFGGILSRPDVHLLRSRTVELPDEPLSDASELLLQLEIEAVCNMACAGGEYGLVAYGEMNKQSLRLLARHDRVTLGPEIDGKLYANLNPVED